MKKSYDDRFAEIRQISIRNRAICYWRNNLSIKDFKKEDGRYVLYDTGNYNGLNVWMRITVEEGSVKRLFQRNRKGVIEFWGKPKHMGIMVRMRTKNFPKVHRGSEGWLTYEFGMDGTKDGLSFRNEEEMERQKTLKTIKTIHKEDFYNEKLYHKEAC